MDTTDNTTYKFFFTELSKIINNTDNTDNTPPTNIATNYAASKNNIIISSTLTPTTPVISTHDADADDADNYCLITKERLHPNHVTLSCNHKFNYIPIYKEIVYQKNKANTTFEITKLSYDEIKCPYCRRITRKLLPYIPYPSVKQIKYVNSPDELCMSTMKCCHVFKHTQKCVTGGDVGDVGDVGGDGGDDSIDEGAAGSETNGLTTCTKNALYYEQENVLFCVQHYKQYTKKMRLIEDKKAKEYAKTKAKQSLKDSAPKCQIILKGGKNKGGLCGRVISIEGATSCKIHTPSS